MTGIVTLFNPTAPRHDAEPGHSPVRFHGLAGAVVGFIDNAKPNFNHLVDDLAGILKEKYGVARIVKRRKQSASIPALPEGVEALSGECDVVIAGSGD
jgi:hypothetical protein